MSINCKECGAPIDNGAKFCRCCGTPIPQEAPTPVRVNVQAAPRSGAAPVHTAEPQPTPQPIPQPQPIQYNSQPMSYNGAPQPMPYNGGMPQPQPMPAGYMFAQGESKFDGGVLATFGTFLGASLLMALTLFIATPWAICMIWNFIISHVTIDGRRLTFDGNGAQLLGNWIKWFLLTLITFGIYGFWVYPKLFNWVAKHTHFA